MEGTEKTITVRINRKERQIPVNSIMYAQVSDKLCAIHLYGEDTPPIRIFLTIAALMEMLPKDQFYQISRSCVISLAHYQQMDGGDIILTDNVRIPYSRKNRAQIRSAVSQYRTAYAESHNNPQIQRQLMEEFHSFDRFPLPFCIIETIAREDNGMRDYLFRYVNDAFASYVSLPAYQLINSSFFSVFQNPEPQWNLVFTQCSLQAQKVSALLPGMEKNTAVQVFCYQPHYGFCACMLMEG
ncbi:MAG: LytTR family transcriptional regulator DNA-binding domain-containing protein [Lachnospiraceae bacterium]|nr:LytTR family transcriptional regulator DNA-binding domain-containing protein [Lachnospiraceae bacterium]